MADYTRKTIYLGIDVHKKTYHVTAVYDGKVVKNASMKAAPEELLKFCNRAFPEAEIESAYEAGFSGFPLHRFLVENGISNTIVNPSAVETRARERVKNDRIDSKKLALQLSQGRFACIDVPSEEREKRREITRLRDAIMAKRGAVGRQMKMFLYRHNLIAHDDTRRVSARWVQSFREEITDEELLFAFEEYSNLWLHLSMRLKAIDEKIALQAEEDSLIHDVYMSVPGVGITTARSLANELGDLSQFSSKKKLYAYTGLTPYEYSSGENQRLGHISRQGKAHIRGILVELAWRAIKKDLDLLAFFEKVASTKGKKRAIVAVARKMIGKIKACFDKGEKYQVSFSRPKPENVSVV